MQDLDKKLVSFLKPYKGNGRNAWDVLRKSFKSFKRLGLRELNFELANLEINSNETVIDCLTRAEEIQYILEQVNKGVSEKMLTSIILKGIPKQFETFSTIAKFSRDEKHLDELKRDLVSFDSER